MSCSETSRSVCFNLFEKIEGGLITGHKYLHKEKDVCATKCFNLGEKGIARTKTWKLMSDQFK